MWDEGRNWNGCQKSCNILKSDSFIKTISSNVTWAFIKTVEDSISELSKAVTCLKDDLYKTNTKNLNAINQLENTLKEERGKKREI